VQSPHLYWPSDRKLFRQRSRLRSFAPAVAAVVLVVLALVATRSGWF